MPQPEGRASDRAPSSETAPRVRRNHRVTIRHTWRLGALAFVAAFAIGACSGGGRRDDPTGRATAPRAGHRRALLRRCPGPSTIDGSSTVYPDHRGGGRGVPAPPTRASRSRSRCPAPAAGSRSSASARPTSTTPRGRSRPTTRARASPATANGIEYVELQVAIDGLTVVVNPANTFATCLTVERARQRSTARTRPRT